MPKTKISEYSTTNSDNTDIESINIAEGCAPSGINNAIRELMVHLKEFQTGASGDAFTFAGGVLISGTANTITGNVLMSGTNTITGSTTATFAAGAVGTPSIAAHGDTNTGIFFPAADTIAFAEGGVEAMRINSSGNVGIGTTSPSSILHIASSSQPTLKILYTAQREYGLTVTGSATTDGLAIRDESDSLEIARFCRSGNVGIGTSSPNGRLEVVSTSAGANTNTLFLTNASSNANTAVSIVLGASATPSNRSAVIRGINAGSNAMNLAFLVSNGDVPEERARITSGGIFGVGLVPTGSFSDGAGFQCGTFGAMLARDSDPPLAVNRRTNDGTVISIRQDGVEEGTISVSGNTVSYNSFAGSHWSQLQQGRGYNPEILRGTVMSSIGEMCEWKSVTWIETIEHPAVPAVEAKEAVLDKEGNVIEPAVEEVEGKDAWTETKHHHEDYLGQLPIGATFTEDGVTKTVVDDGNERLPKVKVSDVVGDKAVYGVFQTWDEVQDMLVTSLGAFVVRIAAGVTVQIGDLLESNGDGCAKVQDDDVIRSKTIGKVTSTTPSATYADGSYTVPAVLYCG